MHRFTLNYDSSIFKIDIEDYKFIIGNNFHNKFKLYETLKAAFNKMPNSDYAIEKNNKYSVTFDDKPIDSRKWKFFEITPFFDLENDMKIGTKSLIGKYLDAVSNNFEQNEIFNTLSILVNSINDDFLEEETAVSFGDKEFKLRLADITKSILLKEIFAEITCEDIDCNYVDLSYEEIILLQLNLLEKIASKNKDKLLFIYCYIPCMTPKIKNKILGFKYVGCFLIVDTLSIRNVDISKIALSSKHSLDFCNDDMIYDLLMDMPFHIEVGDFVSRCENAILSGDFSSSDRAIIEIFPWEIYNKNS